MVCYEKREALKSSAMELGFDGDWVADVLEKWGDELLGIIVEIARNGISVDFIIETLRKFGPFLLELLANVLNRRSMVGLTGEVVPGPVLEGVNGAFLDSVIERFLPQILERILPNLLEQYGDKIFQFIVKWLMDILNKN